ncbi:hypothetical protein FisN_13Hh264 [Fistulifera solaris]|jgi:hypothetical protein|uniref:DUF6816 domain-containing protein n=1 Tax=Fistulifera solaris TaxID=1519565 RepID=A0A1Z5KNF3_FISSO|nr:hypothetical protein FisN_13Hh264 [Fistulifera solaris]|eukprot:GAX27645.1 hypothetical protein FisN_13Hh264 [Fistulifera solaris]
MLLRIAARLAFTTIVSWLSSASALEMSRRAVLAATTLTTAIEPNGLAFRLQERDPAALKNRLFNLPPAQQVYPKWMRGLWNIEMSFSGFLFPSQTIAKETLLRDFGIAGFQKCSIAHIADVGKEKVMQQMAIDRETGWEDRIFNLRQTIDAHLGYTAVQEVVYDGKKNPNRIGINFVDYRTTNAERIELFCNAREAEEYETNGTSYFVHSEYIRQVTFGTGSTVGVPRQVSTNYGHFWTWKKESDGSIRGNLLTAAYLDPQDPLYFQEPALPVVIYSHLLTGTLVE